MNNDSRDAAELASLAYRVFIDLVELGFDRPSATAITGPVLIASAIERLRDAQVAPTEEDTDPFSST